MAYWIWLLLIDFEASCLLCRGVGLYIVCLAADWRSERDEVSGEVKGREMELTG